MDRGPEDSAIIEYFGEGLKALLKVEIEQRGQQLDSFDKMIEKVVAVKAKAALRSRSYSYKINQYCTQSGCPAATKFYAQHLSMNDFRVMKLKART